MASTPKKTELKEVEPPKESDVVREARKQIARLISSRVTAVENLNTAIANMKEMERQAFLIRGKIMAYEEEVEDLRRRYGIKEDVS